MKAIFEVKRLKQSVTQGVAVVFLNSFEIAVFADVYAIGGIHGDGFCMGKDGELQWGSVKPDETFIMAALFPNETRRKYYPDEVAKIERRVKQILQGRDEP
jgi:hypothetical protein